MKGKMGERTRGFLEENMATATWISGN